jgi:hypothetical protein
MEAAAIIAWRPLGEMLVDRGLLTMPELDDALEEQERTGERLGAILVARKIVPGAVLTTVLAEQLGVELETQGGFGSGLFTKIARRNGKSDPSWCEEEPHLVAVPDVAPVASVHAYVDDVLAELDRVGRELDASSARCAELEAELRTVKAAARRKVAPTKTRKLSAKAKAVSAPKPAPKKPTSARAKAKSRATKPKPS